WPADQPRPVGKLALPELATLRLPKLNAKGQNKTEAMYDSRKLAIGKANGLIKDYAFETMKFRLAKRTWFTPDFPVLLLDYTLALVEVKGGYIREDAMIKLKVAAEQ